MFNRKADTTAYAEGPPGVCGVVVMLISPEGRVEATSSDFDRSGYGGFKLSASQLIRCKRSLARTLAEQSMSTALFEVLDGHTLDTILEDTYKKGWVRHIVYIGHKNPEEDER
ncbi:hypothetical protein AA14337_3029 [Acetobacter malorum DSM 14337]|uniref:Uncharacterized protein n=1 Tax=Acetobacter malorum DSM 14337 TaxID=1307910 RepID=A0ABQ0PZ85_9PROT|nr:hypothetical protein AD930_10800 [Acetobacter malorum]GBQ85274.1 hypothetical protein AA14337_3029 [Acetobacter malorum DSM 14337]